MSVTGVLVLAEEVQYTGGFVPSEKVVTNLVVLADRGYPNHVGHPARDSRDMLAELDELLDGHHILPSGDDLDLGQPELLVPLDEFAVEAVQVRELLVVQPVAELA